MGRLILVVARYNLKHMTLVRFIRNTLVVCGKSYVNRGDGRIGSKWQRRCRQILHDQAFVAWKVSCYEARNINNHVLCPILCVKIFAGISEYFVWVRKLLLH